MSLRGVGMPSPDETPDERAWAGFWTLMAVLTVAAGLVALWLMG